MINGGSFYMKILKKVNKDYEKMWEQATVLFKKEHGHLPKSKSEYQEVSVITIGIREEVLGQLWELGG